MEFRNFISIVSLGLLVYVCSVSAQAVQDEPRLAQVSDNDKDLEGKDDAEKDESKCFHLESILDLLKDLENQMDNSLGDTISEDDDESSKESSEEEPTKERKRRSAGFDRRQGYRSSGYNSYNSYNNMPYRGGARYLPWLGGYSNYVHYPRAHYNNDYNNRRNDYGGSRFSSFVQSFKPGHYHVNNDCSGGHTPNFGGQQQVNRHCIVHNYYKVGSYTSAKTEFLAMPFVRVVPVTTTRQETYVGQLYSGLDYTATLCDNCHNGYPQIEMRCNTRPFNHIVRRFTFMPESDRQQVHIGAPQDIYLPDGHHSKHAQRPGGK